MWHTAKTNKYSNLCKQLNDRGYQVEFFAVEVGCRGLIPKSAVTFIRRLGLGKKRIGRLSSNLSQIAIKCSMRIFNSRTSKTWEAGNIWGFGLGYISCNAVTTTTCYFYNNKLFILSLFKEITNLIISFELCKSYSRSYWWYVLSR